MICAGSHILAGVFVLLKRETWKDSLKETFSVIRNVKYKYFKKDSFSWLHRFFCPSDAILPFLDDDVLNEEELDKELLWNLQLLSEVLSIFGIRKCYYKNVDLLLGFIFFCKFDIKT